ncbi:Rhodanese-like protein [Cutaneotrichosporon oleaginosum]|uniref:Rhodanese-like protein n=1 Tax=Cutaneotrichosporon oleaginosum TaxID=879819 RepID=A0A0J0XBX2_9TREE|nr:Rhodanese-like protein [Cutaneotrichosporon oleaginosum]KLT38552.1 Rhodanese-like protein [Cutaneotrichosporon oleaginosum]TXT08474.1 hypothetical protein COLE_05398 [Cutaneotrichosporon oleaginosum]
MYALRAALRTPVRTAPRALSTSAARWKDAWASSPDMNFTEFNKHVRSPNDEVLLIDTREPDEAAISPIPGTVNLPFSKVAEALAEGNNPGKFQNDFAFPKPAYNQKIVFLDRAAKRSESAADAARKAGYQNVRTYGGGVKEYQENAHKHHE